MHRTHRHLAHPTTIAQSDFNMRPALETLSFPSLAPSRHAPASVNPLSSSQPKSTSPAPMACAGSGQPCTAPTDCYLPKQGCFDRKQRTATCKVCAKQNENGCVNSDCSRAQDICDARKQTSVPCSKIHAKNSKGQGDQQKKVHQSLTSISSLKFCDGLRSPADDFG